MRQSLADRMLDASMWPGAAEGAEKLLAEGANTIDALVAALTLARSRLYEEGAPMHMVEDCDAALLVAAIK